MANKQKPAPTPTPETSTADKDAPFKTLAHFEKRYPDLNVAEFLESVGHQLGLLSRS